MLIILLAGMPHNGYCGFSLPNHKRNMHLHGYHAAGQRRDLRDTVMYSKGING
jgi:hypothetical protein